MIEDDEDALETTYKKLIEHMKVVKTVGQPMITATQAGTNHAGTIQGSKFTVSPAWYEDYLQKPRHAPSPVEYMVILRYIDTAADEVKTKTAYITGASCKDAIQSAVIKYNLKAHIVSAWAMASFDLSQIL